MSNLIENNAYRILGLDTASNQKDILRRYKEIINRLKIDDHPQYDLDAGLPENLRTEETVKEALRKLQSHKDNIKEYFFWFQVSNSNDKKAIDWISKGDMPKALNIWKDAAQSDTVPGLFYKRNLAILYFLLLSKEKDDKYLKQSVSLWKELINSEKFWPAFAKNYSEASDNALDQGDLQKLKEDITKEISDIYTDLSHFHKNPQYVKIVQQEFGTYGEKTEKGLLHPIYKEIYSEIEDLKRATLSKDGKPVNEDVAKKRLLEIYDIIEAIEANFKKLKKSGMYDNSESKIVRDHVAQAIREKVIDVHNNAGLYEEAYDLVKIASKISGTESYRNSLRDDEDKIQKSIEMDKKSLVTVVLKGLFSTKYAEFKPRFVEYDDHKIFYKDVNSISYSGTRTNYGSLTAYFSIYSDNDKIWFTFSDQNTYGKLVGLSSKLIIPVIAKRYADRIFDNGETITIGGVSFDKNGYTRQKFWGGTETVLWGDKVYIPQLWQGFVVLYKEDNGRSRQFASVSMSTLNAVTIPALLKECINRAYAKGLIKVKPVVQQTAAAQPPNSGDYQKSKEKHKSELTPSEGKNYQKWLQSRHSANAGQNEGIASASNVKYYVIKNKRTGRWDICTDNAHNPPLDKDVWAADFDNETEANKYLKDTLARIRTERY